MSNVTTLSPPPTAAPAATLVSAIAAVMAEVHTIAKLGENKFHGYRFARMGDILQEITPLLGKHGIVIFQSETGRAMFDQDNVIAVQYAFTVVHESGEKWPETILQTGSSTCRSQKTGTWDDKCLNKCHTAARKYFLSALFQIPTGEEADADLGENDERPVKQVVRTVVPAPKHALKQGGISDRALIARAQKAWEPKPPKIFRASQAGFDERNPPPHYFQPDANRAREAAKEINRRLHPLNDELPGDLGRPKLDTTERDGVPAFLDRRSPAAEPSYLDLVGGADA
jgi:hypothetical protein